MVRRSSSIPSFKSAISSSDCISSNLCNLRAAVRQCAIAVATERLRLSRTSGFLRLKICSSQDSRPLFWKMPCRAAILDFGFVRSFRSGYILRRRCLLWCLSKCIHSLPEQIQATIGIDRISSLGCFHDALVGCTVNPLQMTTRTYRVVRLNLQSRLMGLFAYAIGSSNSGQQAPIRQRIVRLPLPEH